MEPFLGHIESSKADRCNYCLLFLALSQRDTFEIDFTADLCLVIRPQRSIYYSAYLTPIRVALQSWDIRNVMWCSFMPICAGARWIAQLKPTF